MLRGSSRQTRCSEILKKTDRCRVTESAARENFISKRWRFEMECLKLEATIRLTWIFIRRSSWKRPRKVSPKAKRLDPAQREAKRLIWGNLCAAKLAKRHRSMDGNDAPEPLPGANPWYLSRSCPGITDLPGRESN